MTRIVSYIQLFQLSWVCAAGAGILLFFFESFFWKKGQNLLKIFLDPLIMESVFALKQENINEEESCFLKNKIRLKGRTNLF